MTRLYTEDVNRDGIMAILDSRVDGYTIIPTLGIWQGKRESSLIIELFNVHSKDARAIAEAIRVLNAQDAVAVVESAETVNMVTGIPTAA